MDSRTVGAATLLAAAITFAHAGSGTGGITTDMMQTLVIAIGIAAVPAGIVVGLWSDSYNRQLVEGGVAAVSGTALGILGWGLFGAVTIEGASIAQRLDVVFLVVALNSPVFVAIVPLLFLVGGYTAARAGEWNSQSIDDELTVGLFR